MGEDKSLWGPIMEKVFAKRYGNYEHLIGGLPNKAIQTLTGAPYEEYVHANLSDKSVVWKVLSSADSRNDFITAGTESAESDQI